MKKTFLLLSFMLLSLVSSAQLYPNFHTFEISETNTAHAIKCFSDSMRLSYPYHRIEGLGFDTTANMVLYRISNNFKTIHITFPVIWDEPTARSILAVTDSLAQTDIYNNKLIANEISCRLAGLGGKGDWQTETAHKAVAVDMKYSAKFADFPAIICIPKAMFNQDVIDLITEKFNNPYITHEEADIIVTGQRAQTLPLDTTGYTQLQEKYITSAGTEEEERHYRNIHWELGHIQARGQTIQQYTDSLNRVWYEQDMDRWIGKFWRGCLSIMDYAGRERIYSLIPLIESCNTPEIRDWGGKDRVFAQLKHKDYYQQKYDTYTHILDSCIVYLKNNPELGKKAVFETFRTIQDCYYGLLSIDVDELELIDKLIPALTVTNKVTSAVLGYGNYEISIGVYFLQKCFMFYITNLPRPDIILKDWDKNDVPAKMYQWLLKNKGNYQLRQWPEL